MNNFADELTFSAADGFVSIFQNRMTVSGHIDRWCTGETLKPLSLSSLLFLSVSLSTLSLSPQFYEWKGIFHQTKLLDGFQLHWFLFDLSWEQPYGRRLESWGGWIERGSPVDIYRSRGGNYPGTDANCVYNYWHLCKWAALAIRREVYHNLSRCFVLRFSDWRGCWEIGTFCHLNHGLP